MVCCQPDPLFREPALACCYECGFCCGSRSSEVVKFGESRGSSIVDGCRGHVYVGWSEYLRRASFRRNLRAKDLAAWFCFGRVGEYNSSPGLMRVSESITRSLDARVAVGSCRWSVAFES